MASFPHISTTCNQCGNFIPQNQTGLFASIGICSVRCLKIDPQIMASMPNATPKTDSLFQSLYKEDQFLAMATRQAVFKPVRTDYDSDSEEESIRIELKNPKVTYPDGTTFSADKASFSYKSTFHSRHRERVAPVLTELNETAESALLQRLLNNLTTNQTS